MSGLSPSIVRDMIDRQKTALSGGVGAVYKLYTQPSDHSQSALFINDLSSFFVRVIYSGYVATPYYELLTFCLNARTACVVTDFDR